MEENKPKGFMDIHDLDLCMDCKHHSFSGYDGQDREWQCNKVEPPLKVNIFINRCDEFEDYG